MPKVYSNAKSSSAKRFLLDFVKKAPYTILSIQADGGSEFMAEFEDACAELGIPLIVLSLQKPTYKGGVERGNRTLREEFYNQPNLLADSIGVLTQLSSGLLSLIIPELLQAWFSP